MSVVFTPASASAIIPSDPIEMAWTYSGVAIYADGYVTTVYGTEHAFHHEIPGELTVYDGFVATRDISAPVMTLTVTRPGGWNKQDGTLTVRLDTEDSGAGLDSATASYTVSPILAPPKLDYADEGLDRLLDQFKGSPDLLALATSYLEQVQTLEDAAWPLLAERGIDNMTGDRLDGLGEILGHSRGGRSDAVYRLALKGELAVLQSEGTAEEMIALAQLLIQMPTADYEVIEYWPKGFYIRPVDHVLTQDPALIGTMLDRAISAATTMSFVYSFFADAVTFTLADEGAVSEIDGLLGLGDAITGGGPYVFEDDTTTVGLTDGLLRFNSTMTECRLADVDGDAADQESFLDGLNGDVVYVLSDAGNGVSFTCGWATDFGGFHGLGMSSIQMIGDPLTDLDDVTLSASVAAGGHLSGVK